MIRNPIIQRELIGMLRTRRAMVVQVLLVTIFALLVVLRWPSDPRADLNGARALQVFRLFGYGLLSAIVLLVPAFPAASIIREKQQGTLELLLNSPMSNFRIYLGKLMGVMSFVLLLLVLSIPAAVACYAMGGISMVYHLLPLYGLLCLIALQYSSLGLLVSSHANSTDGAMKVTYGIVLILAVITLGPYLFLQGIAGEQMAGWIRNISPIPAVMEVLGHRNVGSQGLDVVSGGPWRFAVLAIISSLGFARWTIWRLNIRILDQTRDQGVMTHSLDGTARSARSFLYMFGLTDPQRRRDEMSLFINPVMVKEFRCRRFGRIHWVLRLVCACMILSLALTFLSVTGTHGWGIERIGGILVILQVSLIVLLTPSITAGLISNERETGSWQLLQMTPMTGFKIVRGKLASVLYTMLLLVMATLPAYAIMIYMKPDMLPQVLEVMLCLAITALLCMAVSAAISSLVSSTAVATTVSFCCLVGLFAGTMLFWLGRGSPFGHGLVESVLTVNPLAAALSAMQMPGFDSYRLVPANWFIAGGAAAIGFVVLALQTRRLTRPQ